jgi:hypothetical protein
MYRQSAKQVKKTKQRKKWLLIVQFYRHYYFAPCDFLPMPAFYVCADISVMDGVNDTINYMTQVGAYDQVGYM